MGEYTDGAGGMKVYAEGQEPFTHVNVQFFGHHIRVAVSPCILKEAAKKQLLRLHPLAVVEQMEAAWKVKYWHCRMHEPRDDAPRWCHACLYYTDSSRCTARLRVGPPWKLSMLPASHGREQRAYARTVRYRV